MFINFRPMSLFLGLLTATFFILLSGCQVSQTNTAAVPLTPALTATETALQTPVSEDQQVVVNVSGTGTCNGGNTDFETALIGLINGKRADAGVAALSGNGSLTSAARAHSKDMATSNTFSHTGSDGSDPFSRIRAAGYTFSAAAENIFAGNGSYNSPSAAISSWMNSSGHRTNMLNSIYTQVGVGYWCNESSTYGGYFTADFGKP